MESNPAVCPTPKTHMDCFGHENRADTEELWRVICGAKVPRRRFQVIDVYDLTVVGQDGGTGLGGQCHQPLDLTLALDPDQKKVSSFDLRRLMPPIPVPVLQMSAGSLHCGGEFIASW
jgi:hypothetical protein